MISKNRTYFPSVNFNQFDGKSKRAIINEIEQDLHLL